MLTQIGDMRLVDEINRLLDAIQIAAYNCGYYEVKVDWAKGHKSQEYFQGMLDQNIKQGKELREELIAWLNQKK